MDNETVRSVPKPFRRVAVDPAAMGGPPRPLDDGIQEVRTYEVRTPAELRLSYLHGTCDTTYGSRVHETPRAVVVDVDVRPDDVEFCTQMGKIDRIGVTLREPLWHRVVLDSSSGVPLLPQSDIYLVEFQNYDPRRSQPGDVYVRGRNGVARHLRERRGGRVFSGRYGRRRAARPRTGRGPRARRSARRARIRSSG